MEKIYAALLYVLNFITDQEFQRQQQWVKWVGQKCKVIHEDIWTGSRILGAPIVIWVDQTFGNPWLTLLVFLLFASTDWIDGLVVWAKGKVGTKIKSIYDAIVDRIYILSLCYYFGIVKLKIIEPELFWSLVAVEFFSYVLLWLLKIFHIIKDSGNFYEHLKIGKIKFGAQIALGIILWFAYSFFPGWFWWPVIVNTLLGIITIIAGFACACKINGSWIRFLADFFTLGNGICGLYSMFYAKQNPQLAAVLIMFGAGFDLVDGFIASKTKKGHSFFGGLLDSSADLISFGLAPAYLIWAITDSVLISLLYFVTTLTRLIVYLRQKKEEKKPKRSKFLGFPSTAAAIIIASLVFADFPHSSLKLIMIACSFLEVAFGFEWYHFKNLFSLSIRAQMISIGLLIFFIAIGRGGEGMLGLLMAYAILFFRPVADRLLWKE